MTEIIRIAVAAALLAGASGAAAAAEPGADPLASPVWDEVRAEFLPGEAVRFDEAVSLVMPADIENSSDVPLAIRLDAALGQPREIIVIAENNPIRNVVRLFPHRPISAIGLKIRLEMSTPVRAAALDADGVWHVGSAWANVLTPGGCSAPITVSSAELGARVGEIAVTTFGRPDGVERLKFRIIHPMETGFAFTPEGAEIPAYFVEQVAVSDGAGPVADMMTWAAMAPDPIFTLDVPELGQSLRIDARDSHGLAFEAFR